jgi:hypothetical protein
MEPHEGLHKKWSQIRITLKRSKIRIHIKMKSRIRLFLLSRQVFYTGVGQDDDGVRDSVFLKK